MQNLRLAVVVIATVSCSGEVVRLGDGPTSTKPGGQAGSSIGSGRTAAGGSGGVIGSNVGGSIGLAGGMFGGSAGTATAGSAGTAGTTACPHGQVEAGAVLWIGDSWVTIPGTQHTRVRDYARASGAIGPYDDYVIAAAAATTIAQNVDKYNAQLASPTKVKVLIMEAGTWDTYLSGGSDASVNKVSDTFEQFLAKVKTDGTVQHVIYYLVPDGIVPGVAALRPHLEQSCAQSTVNGLPCHFINLQSFWVPSTDTAADGIQASETGAGKIADAIWKVMQDNCIAQ
jgi:hypothetical protein